MRTCLLLTGRRRWLATLLAAGGSIGLGACSGSHEPAHVPAAAAHSSIAPTANVPVLLQTSIDGLRRQLGTAQPLPASFNAYQQGLANTGSIDSVAAFRTGGLTMVVSYDAHTRRVRDLLLLGHHEDSLMGRGALRADASEYLVLPVFRAGNTSHLLGLRVISTQ